MNETEFGEIKNTEIYLEQIKKNIHKKSFSDQNAFKKEIKKRHDKKQIQMLLGRVEDQIEIKKALSHFTTAFFAILSLIFGGMLNYGLRLVAEAGDAAATIIIMVFYAAAAVWFALSGGESKRLKKLTSYKRLLQECLDELPEKKYFRRKV
ncbi:hypothetical protein O2313_03745 [Bacillus amyloliquefaciens]|uniref:hypothetical protein n=1 Tax=Bacillus amyloliquefaciens TaxID=1390 RepID=UPI0022AEB0A5|nr:hypothetical protein [Bacillus amyloliquefaciens]MCZ4246650.1 hypothetical protein [Bacillus amyloliquefaciens]